MGIGYADRAPIIDLGGADPAESDERRHGKERRGEKYNAVRKGVSERSHEAGGRQAACGLEALIEPEPLGKGRLADRPKLTAGIASPTNPPVTPATPEQ